MMFFKKFAKAFGPGSAFLGASRKAGLDEKSVLFDVRDAAGLPRLAELAAGCTGLRVQVGTEKRLCAAANVAFAEKGVVAKVFSRESQGYAKALARAGRIVCDGGLPGWFIKREGQRVLLVAGDGAKAGLVDFLRADWAVFPSAGAAEAARQAYGLDRLWLGKAVVAPGSVGALATAFLKGDFGGLDVVRWAEGDRRPLTLVLTGGLQNNGITRSFRSLLPKIGGREGMVLSCSASAARRGPECVAELEQSVPMLTFEDVPVLSFWEAVWFIVYITTGGALGWCPPFVLRRMERIYERELRRNYPGLTFARVVDFAGYGFREYFLAAATGAPVVRFVHNDMEREHRTRGNFHCLAYGQTLPSVTCLAMVRGGLDEPLRRLFPGRELPPTRVVHNLNDIERIRGEAEGALELGPNGCASLPLEEVRQILAEVAQDPGRRLLLTNGRFSGEKGHERLIWAFRTYRKEHPGDVLAIIGGHGPLWEKTLAMAAEEERGRILVLKNLANPFPLLRAADLFVLSSFYEGMPMVIMEALVLGKPVLTTDLPGVSEFLREGRLGMVVENSEEALLEGLLRWRREEPTFAPFDAEGFNRQALHEAEAAILG